MKKLIVIVTIACVFAVSNASSDSSATSSVDGVDAAADSTSSAGAFSETANDVSVGNQAINFNSATPDRGRANDPEVINSNVDYSGSYKIKNVPAMVAPSLTTTLTETCMGSSSAAFAVAGFGMSGGTTWTDDTCIRRLDAREIRAMGAVEVAKELMCTGENNYNAFKRAAVATGQVKLACVINPAFEEKVTPVVASVAKSDHKNGQIAHTSSYVWADGS